MSTTEHTNDKAPTRPRSGRWVVVLIVTLLIIFGGFFALLARVMGVGMHGFMPPEMAAAYHTPKDVVGDLGGMPVRIDRHIVRYVEYDGDPGWGEKRKGPPPERTHASRLNSFGFYVRYPDMGSLDKPELRADFDRYHPNMTPMEYGLRDKDPWLDGGIQSGSRYPGHGFLDRLYEGTIPNPDQQSIMDQMIPEPSSIKGLELFVARGNAPATGKPWRYEGTGDIYIHHDRKGKVTTYIRCSYLRGTQRYSLCTQEWSMEKHGVNIDVSVTYVPLYLPQWQNIQAKVSQFVLNFRDDKVTDASPPAAGTQQ
jgi:hypothetical protein